MSAKSNAINKFTHPTVNLTPLESHSYSKTTGAGGGRPSFLVSSAKSRTQYIAQSPPSSNEWDRKRKNGIGSMIKRLADIFRGFSLVFGISAPPPGQDERQFVMLWLGIISITIVFFIAVLFAISHFHVA